MPRNTILYLVTIALIAYCSVGFAQTHHMEQMKQDTTKQVKQVYTCPMHPEVQSEKPGECPKCRMKLVLASNQQSQQMGEEKQQQDDTGKEKALKAKQLLNEAKNELYYNCCLRTPCDRCALDHQSCSCNKDIRTGKGICSDCYAGWQLGDGKDIPGITKDNVKPNFHTHKH